MTFRYLGTYQSDLITDGPRDTLTEVYYQRPSSVKAPVVPDVAAARDSPKRDGISILGQRKGDTTEWYSDAFTQANSDPHSLWHLLTHLPKLDSCYICQTAKAQQRAHARVKPKRSRTTAV